MYEGDAGSYHAWCPDDLVMLRRGNIGGAKLSVQKHGFSPPHYSDSSKIAYVIQGQVLKREFKLDLRRTSKQQSREADEDTTSEEGLLDSARVIGGVKAFLRQWRIRKRRIRGRSAAVRGATSAKGVRWSEEQQRLEDEDQLGFELYF
ncbi:hypothetical protein LINPERPRIM_LOCUS17275 [Linum perenne]